MKINKPKTLEELNIELECKAWGITVEAYRESQIIAEYYDSLMEDKE